MIKMRYCPEGIPISDFEVNNTLNVLLDYAEQIDEDVRATYSTENVFYSMQLRILKGEIPHTDVVFEYVTKTIPINEYAVPINPPRGFCDRSIKICEDIVYEQMRKRQCDAVSIKEGDLDYD